MIIHMKLCLISALCLCYCSAYKPVVLIHGIMTGSGSMEMISRRIQEKHPGTKVYNVNRFESWSSLETMWHQVLEIGNDVANISSQHPEGINLIGYSQGGLVARGIVQTFPNVSVSTFISLSSPQAGQYGAGFLHIVFPGLVKDTAYELFYSRVGQHTSVGNYWKDPYHQTLYEQYNVYLPYINNHIKSVQSENFKSNILRLKRLVLIGGPDDQVITPWQSSQFGYYDKNNETVIEMRDQDIYTEDRIGLKSLDQSGRLHLVTVPGVNHFNWHMNVSIVDNYLLPYLD
ncbi:lysosomal thioesterase PPT2 homolog [Aricia agestis]|uniref:lysosomal thioesterase PPT2 homolog n=1 Tax=Aricia agestis TaxID=91739 RepID=UPI001C20553F|nr:lysosomal thioesterase PPT2 homolog [Aricia agestis]XP_041970515.1 lysosomal thioesterase PPT2 homolog [Aricia agestis]XP_041970520.1 lysosomal thioesterase PPT2 homolog [Aricia agestis]